MPGRAGNQNIPQAFKVVQGENRLSLIGSGTLSDGGGELRFPFLLTRTSKLNDSK